MHVKLKPLKILYILLYGTYTGILILLLRIYIFYHSDIPDYTEHQNGINCEINKQKRKQ